MSGSARIYCLLCSRENVSTYMETFLNAVLSVIIITKDKVILITLVYVEGSGRLRNNASYN